MGASNKVGENIPGVGARGRGRPKGTPNKSTKAIKDMILEALENKGGTEYLEKQADENPTAFLGLVGKILPTQLTGPNDGAIQFQDVTQDAEAVGAMLASLTERAERGVTLQ